MSAATDNMNDPLAIFGELAPTHESTEHSESGTSHASNLFDPLGGSQSNVSSSQQQPPSTSDAPLDIMSQISSWGAQNNHEQDGSNKGEEKPQQVPESSPTNKANVMVTKSDAIELSDDLVAEAHREFEETEDKLRKFEEQEQEQLKQ